MADKKNGSQSKKSAGGMTKREAVKKGLGVLGNEATASQLQKHIQDSYGIEMSRKHIGVEKAKILKAAREHEPAAPKPTVKQAVAQKPSSGKIGPRKVSTPQGDGTKGISLRDIEKVKDLVERVGASSLKKLIDVMAR